MTYYQGQFCHKTLTNNMVSSILQNIFSSKTHRVCSKLLSSFPLLFIFDFDSVTYEGDCHFFLFPHFSNIPQSHGTGT